MRSELRVTNCQTAGAAPNYREETPVCHMAVVSDPDGNSMIIHKRKGS